MAPQKDACRVLLVGMTKNEITSEDTDLSLSICFLKVVILAQAGIECLQSLLDPPVKPEDDKS